MITTRFALDTMKLIYEELYTHCFKIQYFNSSPLIGILFASKGYPMDKLLDAKVVIKPLRPVTKNMCIYFLLDMETDDMNILDVVDYNDDIYIVIYEDNIIKNLDLCTTDIEKDKYMYEVFTKIFHIIFYLCDSNYSKISPFKTVHEVMRACFPGLLAIEATKQNYILSDIYRSDKFMFYDHSANKFIYVPMSSDMKDLLKTSDFELMMEKATIYEELCKSLESVGIA